ncbi:Endodeoxyribonuclease RusA [compost metagenome]
MIRYELKGFTARAKARPISGKGRMFMPRPYQEWKAHVREALATLYAPVPTLSPVAIAIEIHSPSRPRGDLDNLAGGLLDAIQPPRAKGDVRAQRQLEAEASIEERMQAAPGSLIGDDRQVIALSIRWVQSKRRMIVLIVEEHADMVGAPTVSAG